MTRNEAISRVLKELSAATEQYGRIKSFHEGAAIIKEEYDELWDVVKLWKGMSSIEQRAAREAAQVAVMAIRFMMDLCRGNGEIDVRVDENVAVQEGK